MPLPLVLGLAAGFAGLVGVGTGIHGAKKMKDANDTMKSAQNRHEKNMSKFEVTTEAASKQMDKLGEFELKILHSFEDFRLLIEKIQNKPEFKEVNVDGVELPKYDGQKIKEVSVGAGVLLGGLGGAALGTAGGFAAAGATTAAVMALGTASTGTAIASLSGAALTNATLAALGGGAIAAGGGGIALGTTILGATTLGVGLLVGGVVFSLTGGKLSQKADEAYDQMLSAEKKINKVCEYLNELTDVSKEYYFALSNVNNLYVNKMQILRFIVDTQNKTDWNDFTDIEKNEMQNLIMLVGLLFKMCQVSLVLKSENDTDTNKVNRNETDKMIADSQKVISKLN